MKISFGRKRELETTKRLMLSIKLWNMRVEANCEEVLKKVSPTATPARATGFAKTYISRSISRYELNLRASRGRQDRGKEAGKEEDDSGKDGESSDEYDV